MVKAIENLIGVKYCTNNVYDLSGEYGVLWTTNTNEEVYFDLCNATKILNHTWSSNSQGYPVATIDGQKTMMHVFLGYKRYDHKDRNPKNNRTDNLRPCTQQENLQNRSRFKNNTSGFTGVQWNKENQNWRAKIKINSVAIDLGSFINKEDAIKARLTAEKKYFGEFAPQQHLFKQYGIEVE